jgi:drug/metabolite transporter (DMT)-like permease
MPLETISKKTHGKSFEFLEAAKTDLLEEKIEVHTSGRSVYVPEVATALDFVFYAFPEKVLHVSKIRINEKESSFDTSLRDGDIIEVDFDKKLTVSFKWFTLVRTATARMKIQEVLKGWDLEKRIMTGKNILQREFDIYDKGNIDVFLGKNNKKMQSLFSVNCSEDLYVLVASGELNSYEIFSAFFPKTKANFLRRIFYNWNLFIGRFFGGGKHTLRLKIIGILDNEVDVLNAMNTARRDLGMTTISSHLRENRKNNTFHFRINVFADKEKSLHDFFMLVEHQKGVVEVMPMLSYRKQRWFMFWILVIVAMWTSFPLILSWEENLMSQVPLFVKVGFLYLNLIPLVAVNYILYAFMRNNFPQLRNTIWVITIGMLMNLFGICVFSWQLIAHGFQVNLPVLVAFFSVLTFVFLYKYLSNVHHSEASKPVKNLPTSKRRKLLGYFYASIVVAIWGIDPLVIKQLVSESNLYFTVGMRFYLGGIFLVAFILLRHLFSRKKSSMPRMSYGSLFWLMALGLAVNFLLYHAGLQYTIASDANLVENFAPIVVLLMMGVLSFGIIHQVGRSKKEIFKMIAVVFIGVLGATLVFSYYPEGLVSDYGTKLLGDFIEVIAMVFFALFIIANNVYMKRNSETSALLIMAHVLLIVGLMFTPFLLFVGWPTLSSQQWLSIGFIGLFSTGVAYVLWSKAAKILDVIPAVLFLNFTAIITIVLENHIYGLPMRYEIILGASLMIVASVSAELVNKKRLRVAENKLSP